MAILPIDSGRYGTKEMLDIFSEQKKIDYQLEIEAAAALSQSEIKIISRNVANDIAKTVLFLIADADYITGQIIAVDGGRGISS